MLLISCYCIDSMDPGHRRTLLMIEQHKTHRTHLARGPRRVARHVHGGSGGAGRQLRMAEDKSDDGSDNEGVDTHVRYRLQNCISKLSKPCRQTVGL
jgi:hypothetical protein